MDLTKPRYAWSLMALLGNESADGVDDDLPGPAQLVPKKRLGIAMFRGVLVGGGEEWGGRREPTHTEAFNDHQDLLAGPRRGEPVASQRHNGNRPGHGLGRPR